jgi:hypothetical protein
MTSPTNPTIIEQDAAVTRPRRIRLITVCDKCFRASCWHGVFMCDKSITAGTIQKTAAELRKLNVEHSDYYSKREVEKVCGGSDYREVTA